MIERFTISNYKALRDVSFRPGRIHVLIGPNDAGKTSVLEAVGALGRSVDRLLADAFVGPWRNSDLVWQHQERTHVSIAADIVDGEGRFGYQMTCRFSPIDHERQAYSVSESFRGGNTGAADDWSTEAFGDSQTRVASLVRQSVPDAHIVGIPVRRIHAALRDPQWFRWEPRMLAMPVARRVGDPLFFIDTDGFGLAACLDEILGDDRRRFEEIETGFCSLFPEYDRIRVRSSAGLRRTVQADGTMKSDPNQPGKALSFVVAGSSTSVPSGQMSDGALIVLAYLTLLHLPSPTRLLLIEEPENGIYPKRLNDIIRMLRALLSEQLDAQIILTTHSPYVLDLFDADEVTFCHKDPDGAVSLVPLVESEAVRRESGMFTLGEIWTGQDDEVLVGPRRNH